MDNKKLAEFLDQQRWLLNNGLISEHVKDQLFFCGSIVHKEVQAVELDIIVESKQINYKIYVNSALLKRHLLYKKLSVSTSLWGMWRFKRLLKREGSLDFERILNKFVKDYCGPHWKAAAQVIDFDTYVESQENERHIEPDQASNSIIDK